jgi:hypothetical protein
VTARARREPRPLAPVTGASVARAHGPRRSRTPARTPGRDPNRHVGVLENVTASVTAAAGDPLLGQSFLHRFRSWSIDNARGLLVLE